MSSGKRIDAVCIAIILFMLTLTALFMNAEKFGVKVIGGDDDSESYFTENDLNGEWTSPDTCTITLSDSGSTVTGNGAYVNGNEISIIYPGYYTVSGELTNGRIVIDTENKGKVWLRLSGVSVYCPDGPALVVKQAKKVFLTLSENSENTFSSGEEFSDENIKQGMDAVVYSRDDLTVNGSGKIHIKSLYGHAIACSDSIALCGPKFEIEAAEDGIHANDSVKITGSEINITAGDDAITAKDDEEKSFIYVESGKIDVEKCYEGIEAYSVIIDGGDISITPEDDGINSVGVDDDSGITINGGNIRIVNSTGRDADGMDSNSDITINGGSVFISVSGSGTNNAIDFGSETGGKCVINGGTVIACGGSAMAEEISRDSSQGFITRTGSFKENSELILTDSKGEELVKSVIPCGFTYLTVSVPGMKEDGKYVLTVDGENVDNTSAAANNSSENDRSALPEKPEGNNPGTDNSTPPEKPEGNFFGADSGTLPEKPEGDFPGADNGTLPEKPEGNFPGADNGIPPAKPEGDFRGAEGGTPPAKPEGDFPGADNGTPPAKPKGDNYGTDNGTPPEKPEGNNSDNKTSETDAPDNQSHTRQNKTDGKFKEQGTENKLSDRELLLTAISALVLLCGIVFTCIKKKR